MTMKMANQSPTTVKDRTTAPPLGIAPEQGADPPGATRRGSFSLPQAASTAGSPSIPEQWLQPSRRCTVSIRAVARRRRTSCRGSGPGDAARGTRKPRALLGRGFRANLAHRHPPPQGDGRPSPQSSPRRVSCRCRSCRRRQLQSVRKMAQATGPLDAEPHSRCSSHRNSGRSFKVACAHSAGAHPRGICFARGRRP